VSRSGKVRQEEEEENENEEEGTKDVDAKVKGVIKKRMWRQPGFVVCAQLFFCADNDFIIQGGQRRCNQTAQQIARMSR